MTVENSTRFEYLVASHSIGNTMRRSIAILSVLFLTAALAQAAESIHIKMRPTGSKKAVVECTCDASGACVMKDVPPGTYEVVMVVNGKELVCGDTKHNPDMFEIQTAREAGSGMATGKRQHGAPIVNSYSWGVNSPNLKVTVDGTTVTCACTPSSSPAPTN
jgi:hypothetical protein